MDGPAKGVTGRDEYLICKALAFAVATIVGSRTRARPLSDVDHMIALLHAICQDPLLRSSLAEAAFRCTGTLPNLETKKFERTLSQRPIRLRLVVDSTEASE